MEIEGGLVGLTNFSRIDSDTILSLNQFQTIDL